jgi:filamentous hemagglutinin family protein
MIYRASHSTVRSLLSSTALVAVAVVCASSSALAAPQGGVGVAGNTVIESTGSTTTIRQTSGRAIIRWDSFNVGASEHVDFQQPSSSSITVNRIQDSNPSQIDGRITANGNIMLLNPNGVVFGAGSRVDVGGVVASTSDLEDDAAFMAGGDVKLTRPGNPDAQIINHGTMTIGQAGLAGLVAPHVENHGVIEARLGKVSLASGDISTIDFAGDGLILVEASDAMTKQVVKNTGALKADGGRILVTAAAARNVVDSLIVNEGQIQSHTVAAQGGHIRLVGSKAVIQNTGKIEAKGSGTENGGQIDIEGSFVALGGEISADGKNGGLIDIKANTLSLADTITAKGTDGQGGSITVNASGDTWETSTSRLNVDGLTDGGSIRSVTGMNLVSSGRYSARGENGDGGQIDVTGGGIRLLSAQMDASGETAGGTIRVGGEFQGGKDLAVDELLNAQIVTLDRGTRLRADGEGNDADGGTVIVWSDADTMALGEISAIPGLVLGDGGFVEISSAGDLSYGATVQTGRDGRAGSVLLDPKNIIIAGSTFNPTAIIMGRGYTGGNNVDMSLLNGGSPLGYNGNISLDGNRLAVGYQVSNGFGDTMGRSGAVYLYSFTDSSFSGGILEGIVGYGFTGGKNVNVTQLGTSDYFGIDVSLDGNRLAVGAYYDDGNANALGDSGAVYLFSFSDSTFSGGTLESRIGHGYTGGKNYSMSGVLGNSDYFGRSVSLSGDRLAVGAHYDDGSGNTVTNSGSVYLFSFSDSVFSNPVLQGTIGNGYTGGKNINISLDTSDLFGSDISLDGNRLAVSSYAMDGAGNTQSASGEVLLFSFTDAVFSGGVLESRIGLGYTGGKNIDNSVLGANDYFGWSVALDGSRLAVGAMYDDANGNSSSDSGAVYLYSFTDSVFSGGVLEARMGNNYAALGGKNLSRPNEAASGDYFGSSVSLDGNRLVVGSLGDDGPTNVNSSQGALHFYTFADSVFTGGTWQGTLGTGYSGGKNITLPFNTGGDSLSTQMGVSVSGTRIAIGIPYDDGFNDTLGNSGAVYLYSFASSDFNSGVLEGIIGSGYTGGKNINLSGTLDAYDFFGFSVSLDGNQLAVGAPYDDGSANALGNSGAVYLFSFTDSVFSGGVLESRIGRNYAGGKNYNPANLTGSSDYFGGSVSLDANRLAVGTYYDDGLANAKGDSGAVYLFSFADSVFTTPTLQSILGYNYTGGKNYNLSQLGVSDIFGSGVSLDGNRLAVTAIGDDGFGDTVFSSGAAYLFTFSDSLFSSPTLQATMGYGYTGGKNVNMNMLETSDAISGIALEGSVLALGAWGDDGFGGAAALGANYGAVYLYNFDDLLFTNAQLDATIGYNYTGGKNINMNGIIGGSDYVGGGLSLDQGNLVAGSAGLDGSGDNYFSTGGAFIYRGNSYAPASGSTFANLPSTTIGITPANLSALLSTPQAVTLQASNDIILDNDLVVNNGAGNGGTLTLQAGRSILLNANIVTDSGDLFIYANEDLASGVVNAQRDAGAATITMAAGTSINAGTGNVTIRLEDGTGKTNRTSGHITLDDITAGTISVRNIEQTSSIILNGPLVASGAGTPITLASGKDFINNYGAGALVTPSGRWLVYSDNAVLNNLNGVSSDFSMNNCVYLGACGAIPGTGNGLLYEYSPNILSISANTSRWYGDANPSGAALQSLFLYTGFQGADTVAVLDSLPTATIAGTATATAAAGTSHAISLTGGADNFYTYYLLDPSFLAITQKPVSATWNSSLTKTYGDSNPNPSLSSFTFSGFANGETAGGLNALVTPNFGSVSTATGVGTYNVSAVFTNTPNYLITAPDTTLTINKRDITSAWTGGLSRVYGDANPNVTTANFTYTGFVNGDTGAVVTASGSYGAVTTSSNVGSYSVGGNFSAANYNITNSPTTTLTINKRNITATVGSTSRVYGDANPAYTWSDVTWSNLANAETGSVLDTMTVSSPTALATSNAGTTHNINLTGFSDNNYNLTGSTAGVLTISKRNITATVGSVSKNYGDAVPSFTWSNVTWNNLANAETGSVLDAMTVSAPTYAVTSNAGTTHAIGITGFSDNNYNLTGSTAGTLSVAKRNITSAWTGGLSRVYGDANPNVTTANFAYTGFVNGDTNAAVTASGDYGAITTATNVGSYAVGANFSATNYNITNSPTTTLAINKRDITATVNSVSKTYGDALQSLSWSDVAWSNLANGETGSVLDALTVAAPTYSVTSNAGTTHNINLTGFSDNNYNLAGSTAGVLSIDKATLTLRVADAQRKAQTPNPTFSYALEGLKNGDSQSVLTGVSLSTSATSSSPQGVYDISASGGVALNYLVASYVDGELIITSNGIPSTVEQALSASSQTVNQSISVETTDQNKKAFVVIPDDELKTDGNAAKGALIAITESLKKLFGIADI